jgi:hypothetical protein
VCARVCMRTGPVRSIYLLLTHTHHAQVIRNLFPKFSEKFVWHTVEEFDNLDVQGILRAIAEEAEDAAKTVTAMACGAGRSRSITLVQHIAGVLKMALLVKRAVIDKPGSSHLLATEIKERRAAVDNAGLPLGSPWMDDVRLALHFALVRGGHTATGDSGLVADRNNRSGIQTTANCSDVCVIVCIVNHLSRFFKVLRCAYAGLPWKTGQQHCTDVLPGRRRQGGPRITVTPREMKEQGRSSVLLPHLRKMFDKTGIAAVSGRCEDLPEELRNIVASKLPTEQFVSMGQVGKCEQSIIPPLHSQSN